MSYKLGANTVIDDSQNVTLSEVQYDVKFLKWSQAMGQNFGYTSGGDATAPQLDNIIDRFPFAIDITNATDVGDLSVARFGCSGQSSTEYGYSSGGDAAAPLLDNIIDRFPFAVASGLTATDVGDLSTSRIDLSGQSSKENGYASGDSLIIDRFPFAVASGLTATNIGNLSASRSAPAGQSSTTHGYASGGIISPTTLSNVIDRFPFATDTGATDVGDLTSARSRPAGQSSADFGYTSGGRIPPGTTSSNIIDRFPFSATTTNATDVGDLTAARIGNAGQSSFEYGYTSGSSNVIDRFPFAATTTNATDVGDLTVARSIPAGQQY